MDIMWYSLEILLAVGVREPGPPATPPPKGQRQMALTWGLSVDLCLTSHPRMLRVPCGKKLGEEQLLGTTVRLAGVAENLLNPAQWCEEESAHFHQPGCMSPGLPTTRRKPRPEPLHTQAHL